MGHEPDEHNVMLAIFSVASGMVGVCLTGIGLLNVASSFRRYSTIADEVLALDATLFLGCCVAAFLSFRVRDAGWRLRLKRAADGMFFVGLLLMVVVCALITTSFL